LPSTAHILDAKLRLYLTEPGQTVDISRAYEEDPPEIPFSVQAGRQPWQYELRFLTQAFQNTVTWNRYQADRRTYGSSTSTSGTGISSSSTSELGSAFPSTSSAGLPGTHEWPGGPGAYGDTIPDGAQSGTLQTSVGWIEIPCREMVQYGLHHNSKVIGLYFAKITENPGIWKYVSRDNYAVSSSESSGGQQALTPELHIWWQDTVSSFVGSASSAE
jgi:hypothetical protein